MKNGKMKFTKSFREIFWEYNYPVALTRNQDTKEVTYKIYLPRKERIWDSDGCEIVPEEELNQFIDNSIIKLKTAIELFEKFKKAEIDDIYYWD